MRNNLLRQHEAYKRRHGVPMPPAEVAHMNETIFALQSMYYEDPPGPGSDLTRTALNSIEWWRETFPSHRFGSEELREALAQASRDRKEGEATGVDHNGRDRREGAIESLCEQGFFIGEVPSPRIVALCAALADALAELERARLPPNFVFVFNEAWLLLDEHWSAAAADILGPDCIMEADMNVWALRSPEKGSAPYIGANFGASHRDQTYSACHSDDGTPTSVNFWSPLNPSGATADNGAMRVLPVPYDEYFFSPGDPVHMNTKVSLDGAPESAVDILECSSGTACVWSPALVHWGGNCEANLDVEPRASMAVTFRSKSAPPSVFGTPGAGGGVSPASGPPPLARGDLHDLTLARRLAYVAKGVLAFSHWHPGFPGINLTKEEVEQ
ncbi:hypothetical protein ACHAWF_013029 [Thalassiosira exigua]